MTSVTARQAVRLVHCRAIASVSTSCDRWPHRTICSIIHTQCVRLGNVYSAANDRTCNLSGRLDVDRRGDHRAETFLERQRVFGTLRDVELAVRQAIRQDPGRLRVGASSTACQYIIPKRVREFCKCFPGYTLSITPGDTPLVTELLLDRSISD